MPDEKAGVLKEPVVNESGSDRPKPANGFATAKQGAQTGAPANRSA